MHLPQLKEPIGLAWQFLHPSSAMKYHGECLPSSTSQNRKLGQEGSNSVHGGGIHEDYEGLFSDRFPWYLGTHP